MVGSQDFLGFSCIPPHSRREGNDLRNVMRVSNGHRPNAGADRLGQAGPWAPPLQGREPWKPGRLGPPLLQHPAGAENSTRHRDFQDSEALPF